MAHTNVGLANCAIGAINGRAEHVPSSCFSGRTPVDRIRRLGSRTVPIGWGQEMRDQTALVREAANGTTSCASPTGVGDHRPRARDLSTPKGGRLLSVRLPREVLCGDVPGRPRLDRESIMQR